MCLARITRHLPFVIPAAAERRSHPESAGRGAFGNSIGEPTTDHAARYYKFESGFLQRRVSYEPDFLLTGLATDPADPYRPAAAATNCRPAAARARGFSDACRRCVGAVTLIGRSTVLFRSRIP